MAKSTPAPERFWPKVRKTETCWVWTASTDMSGYGQFAADTRRPIVPVKAHRFAYELLRGPIPDGLEIDHLCKNRLCVNPDHLEAVTSYVNNMRSDSAGAMNARKTACPRGHEYDGLIYGKWRRCRTCANERDRAAYWRRKAESQSA